METAQLHAAGLEPGRVECFPSGWSLVFYRPVSGLRPVDFERPLEETLYVNRHPDGRTEKLPAGTTCAVLRHASGQGLALSVRDAWHIIEAHISPGRFSSTFAPDLALEDVLRLLAASLDKPPEIRAEIAFAEVDTGWIVGSDTVASCAELVEAGELAEDDLAPLALVRRDALAINTAGKVRTQELFVNGFNQGLARGRVRLSLRKDWRHRISGLAPPGLIVPHFLVERRQRTSLVMVLRRAKPEYVWRHAIVTLYPGHVRDPLPNTVAFWGGEWHPGAQRMPTVAELYERPARGATVDPDARELLRTYERSQATWWEQGFIE